MEALLIFETNKWHIIYMEITNHILLWKSGKKEKKSNVTDYNKTCTLWR